ncbi:MAG: hypothetical protein H8E44_48075 [Planctomycetes bacterium]|nr:hypothetical protein [Planctomycetota bacterium]MBL7037873.1 hypothetical protein [Pirellulaceae bacterium]
MNLAILRLPILSWTTSGLVAAGLLAAGCSRQPANPLPDVSRIERMTASLEFRPRQVVAATLKDTSWLGEINLYGVHSLHGKVPVEWAETDTVFCLHLFPDESGRSDWVIYLRLSGKSGRPKEEALAFLKGEPDVPDNPKLVEYAICFPDGRIERYSKQGLAVYRGSIVVDHARFGE